ncbi:OmpA/MotB domain protein [Geobacter metallireducens RCH3]|uniref:Peptidoglycan-binding protein, OmpA family n=1 Tax=Geobacter metallireducens (strain ATCC 53774 / DSM 7210 / GS-15) TaxID=269799 RepID=Q39UL3_GEOMG|nr:OmpA family protein [Geobacter metallireducens]ABB32061.1 peptidoglycan-binding protein, OmpA family [Geobacter metallireducens GS-15]EHP88752.1 OmpA/MotB domain protein [Geobacter metallireducens RCH3]
MTRLCVFIIAALVFAASAFANPAMNGSTGLITVPSAETLDAGNICVGAWGISTAKNSDNALTVPVALTLGIGTFWELYGSYPNLLFNGDEEKAGQGYAELGSKLRVIGKRSSPFKLALDLFLQRQISEDAAVDGTTNGGGKVIASYTTDRFGVHAYSGYLLAGSPEGKNFDNEILYGVGIEYSPALRMRVTGELTGNTSRDPALADSLEGLVGFQYYLSPHLTLNLAGSIGFADGSPDWRAIFGLTACQGVGSYVKPVPRLGQGLDPLDEQKKKEPVKIRKIIPISSLLVSSLAPQAPANKLEVTVEPGKEEITIKPYGQVTISAQPAAAKAVSSATLEEVSLTQGGEEVRLASRVSGTLENSALEYTLARLEGITPLYSVDVKGQNVQVASARDGDIADSMKVYRKFRFPDVTFDFDQWSLSAEGKKSISEVAELVRKDTKWVYLRVDGYTDNIGSTDYNMDLSLKRAVSVASYLVAREGIDAAKIFIKGLGKSKPLADNATSDGRKLNRRCEILFLIPKES